MTIYDSLHNIPIDALAEKVGGRHKLTFIVSKRMEMINLGSPLLVEKRPDEALLATVCREIQEGKVWLEEAGETVGTTQPDYDILGLGGDEN